MPTGISQAAMAARADAIPCPTGEQQLCTAEQLLLCHLLLQQRLASLETL
jgi:hypothetical protein